MDQEEVDEKAIMTPGNIAMLLNETGGLRVQVTSPTLGEEIVIQSTLELVLHGQPAPVVIVTTTVPPSPFTRCDNGWTE